MFRLWHYSFNSNNIEEKTTGQTTDAGHMGVFLRWLVWVGAKNLNEDKLVPAGAIRQKMNPLCTRRFLLHFLPLPPSLSLHPSIPPLPHTPYFPPAYSLKQSRWMFSSFLMKACTQTQSRACVRSNTLQRGKQVCCLIHKHSNAFLLKATCVVLLKPDW